VEIVESDDVYTGNSEMTAESLQTHNYATYLTIKNIDIIYVFNIDVWFMYISSNWMRKFPQIQGVYKCIKYDTKS